MAVMTPHARLDLEESLSPRLNRLRERALRMDDDTVDPAERPVLVTESWKQTESDPFVLRMAKALRHTLANTSVKIFADDLVAGMPIRIHLCHTNNIPNEDWDWVPAVSAPEWNVNRASLDDERVPRAVKDALRYWLDKPSVPKSFRDQLTDPQIQMGRLGIGFGHGTLRAHTIPNFQRVLEVGFEGIQAEAQGLLGEGDTEGRTMREAVIIACDAAIVFAKRYAGLAQDLASQEADSARRAELEEIARVCEQVPAGPARTFREALQAIWFTNIIQEFEMGGSTAHCFGRLDQYLAPYYERDVANGDLTPQQALDLILEFFTKTYRIYDDRYIMVGGRTADGSDGTNSVTFLVLEAMLRLRFPTPVGVRFHSETPEELHLLAARVIKLGMGRPDVWNDEVTIPALVDGGIPAADAAEYSVTGCVEICVPGVHDARTMAMQVNALKCLELAIHGGRCQITGEQAGPVTPIASGTAGEVWGAFETQLRHFIRASVGMSNLGEAVVAGGFAYPLLSALTEGCVESGRDIAAGGARLNTAGACLLGLAETANSLAAIETMVGEDGSVPWSRLHRALASDFEDDEELRLRLRNKGPKYGNDDPSADGIANRIVGLFADELSDHRNARGGPWHPMIFTTTFEGQRLGGLTAASADGRHTGEPVAPAVAPTAGTERKGPTAAVRSVCAIDYRRTPGGVSYIPDWHPSLFSGEEGTRNLAAMLQAFVDLGGMEMGPNVLSIETLREAQRDPERFKHLTVRVFGFTATFVDLTREAQEYLINKLEPAA